MFGKYVQTIRAISEIATPQRELDLIQQRLKLARKLYGAMLAARSMSKAFFQVPISVTKRKSQSEPANY
jgi:hypothetical protein